ncbi:MAG: hypothetical protein JNM38_03620 [Acidobacteria bacterium]|nr:hypothetical protein [Acidobacteriota bacterium]
MLIAVSAEVSAHVVAGVIDVDGVSVTTDDAALGDELQAAAAAAAASAERADVTAAVRGMYRRFGVDPTRTRPSSEALLRRVRKGDPLPRVNTLVDIGNWCSLETQLPFGIYDLAAIHGPVTLRVGTAGEEYAGIRKDVVHVAGRLTLADDEGPFGNPSSDSARTMVTAQTRRALIVIFTPRPLGAGTARAAMRLTGARVLRCAGGRIVGEDVQ